MPEWINGLGVPTLAEIDAALAERQTPRGGFLIQMGHGLFREFSSVDDVMKALLADDPADLPELARLAARLEPTLRRAFLNAVEATKSQVDLEAVATALMSGHHTEAEVQAQLDVLTAHLDGLGPVLREGFLQGATFAHTALATAGIAVRFDLVNPHAVTWAATQAARLVVDITDSTRQSIRDLIASSVSGGDDVRATARALRDVIGLDPRRAAAVDAFRARTGDDARTAKYAAAQLRQRATVISRTETLTAESEGQRGLWTVATQQGLLDPGETRKVWITTMDDRTDEECEALDGAESDLDGVYPGDGGDGPPLHPQCRCSEGLVFTKGGD